MFGLILGGFLVVQAPTQCDASWSGTVVDADTGEGVPAAQIELESLDSGTSAYGRSDDQGRVQITGVCPGATRVFAAEPDHSSISVDIEIEDSTTDTR